MHVFIIQSKLVPIQNIYILIPLYDSSYKHEEPNLNGVGPRSKQVYVFFCKKKSIQMNFGKNSSYCLHQ